MNLDNTEFIPLDELKIGMFIKLDLSWFEHSFSKSSFKIVNEQQIVELKALNLKQIRVVTDKTDIAAILEPEQLSGREAAAGRPDPNATLVFDTIIAAKRERLVKLQKQRAEIERCEQKFVQASAVIKNIDKLIFSQPKETVIEASKLIDGIAQIFSTGDDTLMHLIRYQQGGGEDLYFHTLNVAFVAMMIGHELNCTEEQVKAIGIAALFHDLGKVNIPDHINKKLTRLTTPEQNIYEQHAYHGLQIGQKAGLDRIALDVIANHHEYMDGTGFPNKLKGNKLSLVTRIISVANKYDTLCNHVDSSQSLTPHAALATMFSQHRSQFDPTVLAVLVKCLGIYPPGTIVRLSDDSIGMVINVNTGKSLRPQILVYDEDIPAEGAIILDLATDASLQITESIRPSLLTKPVFDYLNPRKRIHYFLDSKTKHASESTRKEVH